MNIKKWKQFNENLYDDNLLQKLKKTISLFLATRIKC